MLTRSHPLTRRLRALRSEAALRESEGVFVAEGIHLAADALEAGASIEAAVVSARLLESAEGRALEARVRGAGIPIHDAPESILDQLQDARSPQPVLLLVRRPAGSIAEVVAGRGGTPLLVAACGVQDPGNVGALWRTADAAGATGFVATEGSASLTHPRCVRASMGSIFRLAAVEAGIGELLREARKLSFRVIGADARGAVPYDEADWSGPVAVLVGGEGAGLPKEAEGGGIVKVRVPMASGVESLSVNAAAAVLSFAAARMRRHGGRKLVDD